MKIFTLSFDDGVTQDRRFIGLLKKYGLTCTFNVNSALLGTKGEVITGKNQSRVPHDKVDADEVASLYDGFEVAVHTRTHPMLTGLSAADILEQVVGDSVTLSSARRVSRARHGVSGRASELRPSRRRSAAQIYQDPLWRAP